MWRYCCPRQEVPSPPNPRKTIFEWQNCAGMALSSQNLFHDVSLRNLLSSLTNLQIEDQHRSVAVVLKSLLFPSRSLAYAACDRKLTPLILLFLYTFMVKGSAVRAEFWLILLPHGKLSSRSWSVLPTKLLPSVRWAELPATYDVQFEAQLSAFSST